MSGAPPQLDVVVASADRPPKVNRKRLLIYGGIAAVVGIALYFSLPQLAGFKRSLEVLRKVDPIWISGAILLAIGSFACYIFLYGGVIGGRFLHERFRLKWTSSYHVSMASLGATTIVTAGGAGGIALTLWALHSAGIAVSSAGRRTTAFLIILYSVYLGSLLFGGILLFFGVAPTSNSLALTLVPALIAAGVVGGFLVLTLVYKGRVNIKKRKGGFWQTIGNGPKLLADSTQHALNILSDRRRAVKTLGLAIGYWAFNLGVFWVLFRSFGISVSPLVLAQGFFIGMTASLIPLLPGGVGSIEAGLFGAFVAFGLPGAETALTVLAYRLVTFWLPTIPEIIAFIHVQRKISRNAKELLC